MANHTAAKTGGWGDLETITPTQITHIQEALLKCPNFSEGSTHSLTGALVIGQGGGGSMSVGVPLVTGDIRMGELGVGLIDIEGQERYYTAYLTDVPSYRLTRYAREIVGASVLSANRSVVFAFATETPLAEGVRITLWNRASYSLTITDEDLGGTVATVAAYNHLELRFAGSSWDILRNAA